MQMSLFRGKMSWTVVAFNVENTRHYWRKGKYWKKSLRDFKK